MHIAQLKTNRIEIPTPRFSFTVSCVVHLQLRHRTVFRSRKVATKYYTCFIFHIRSAEDPDPELCGLVGSGTFPGPQKLYILGRFILKAS
jgi:hypothetical protein